MADPVIVERRADHRVITLNRPERLDAFDAMHAALDEAAADPACRAVLLNGAGRGFCAGQDLGARPRAEDAPPPDLGATLEESYNPLIRRIAALRVPVVCAVNGVAAGGGANLALSCDVVFAARSARFIQSFSRIGLVPEHARRAARSRARPAAAGRAQRRFRRGRAGLHRGTPGRLRGTLRVSGAVCAEALARR